MSSATAESKTTLADAAKVSELKDLGWSVIESDGTWTAHEKAGELRSVGPAASIKALYTQVKLAAGEPHGKTVKVGSSKLESGEFSGSDTPSNRLPGMEEPAIEELDAQADICIEAFEKKKNAATASKDQDDVMRQKMHEFERKRYSRRGWSIVIEDSEKLVIKRAEGKPAANPKSDVS